MTPDRAQEALADRIDSAVPARGDPLGLLVGMGSSAGAIPPLQAFLRSLPVDTGQAFAVVLPSEMMAAPSEVLQHCTPMPVVQLRQSQPIAPNHVYVIPPGQALRASEGYLHLTQGEPSARFTLEQHQSASEVLKARNEELQAMNVQLRAATVELETSREALQSINEELVTVNHELKSKVDELGHANSDLHNLMDATAIATVFLDRELCITRYTPSAVTLFNLIATDLGRPLADLATRLDYPELSSDARRVLERMVPIEREVGLPGGSWFLSRLLPYRTLDDRIAGVVVSLIDITERKQGEEVRLWLSAVVASSTDAIFSFSMDRTILSWNAGAERIFGYGADEAIGEQLLLLAPGLEETRDRILGRLREGESVTDLETLGRCKEGVDIQVALSVSPIKDSLGTVIGGTAIARDVTQQKQAAQALERSQAELMRALAENEKARSELQVADIAKDRFLAVLSHELRNPLASIDSAAALMLTPALPVPDRESAAKVVKRQAGAMKSLLDDLLDVSRLKLGRLELQREVVNLDSVVEAALETVRPMLEAVGHTLTLDLPACPVQLNADPLRLCQVLSNLLTNSVKYTRPGGSIVLKARLEGEQAVICVSDNGVGMDPGQIEHMFEMFAQAQPMADRSHGLGIGLALVKSLVEMHGGRVEAFSDGLGRGSEFRLILPAVRGSEAPAEPAATAPVAAQPAAKRGLILIADDNVDAGWGIAKLLEIAGFETLRVKGGLDAVREAARQKPDVGIIDIGMPDLNGHDVARQLRQTAWGRKMVLIAATGWGQESDEREAIDAGFDAHMTKPVDLRKLSALVDELLARRRD